MEGLKTATGILSRQLALPGWGPKAQDKIAKLRIRVQGQDAAAGTCREYLGRAGVAEKAGDLDVLFDAWLPESERALLVSGAALAFWSRQAGPCLSCISKAVAPENGKDAVIRGSLAAGLALTWAAGLAAWKPGRILRLKPDFETVEESLKSDPDCPDCRKEA